MNAPLSTYLAFLRPFTLLPPALGMLSGSLVALGAQVADNQPLGISGYALAAKIAVGALLAAILNGASNSLNQIFDYEIDRINKPDRPLPSGRLSRQEAWVITSICYLVALIMAAWVSRPCFWIVAVTTLFTIAYSAPPLRTKRHWLPASFTIAIPRGMLLKVAGWAVVREVGLLEPWLLGAVFALFLLGATTTKDYADMEGDQSGKCMTLPLRFGIVCSIWIIAPFLTLPFWLFPLGVITGILTGSPSLLWILGVSLSLWGCYLVFLLLQNPRSLATTENHPSWRQMYFMMMYAQIGLAVAYLW